MTRIARITTLAGYVHWRLTGRHVLGVGEASGVFPIGVGGRSFDANKFQWKCFLFKCFFQLKLYIRIY